jgi:exopolyphosphatase/guanosine-5'-triphosphate,3'-diphosphate pyrophosphatase
VGARALSAEVIVGAIDLGTNSTRLLVADVEGGRVAERHRETRITRLGEAVDARGILLPAAIARVRNVLVDYRRTLEKLGVERTLAIATSAVRDAENGEAFLGEIEWSYGFATRLLSGAEEARLTRRGVGAGRALEPGTLVVDIGGGSTELVLDELHTSLDIGSVRLTERFLHGDPLNGAELAACAQAVRELLPEASPAAAIGVAGTVTTIAALDLGLETYDPARVHGHILSAAAVAGHLERLASLTVTERRALPSMEPERAPVIVGGAIVLAEIVRCYGLDGIEASERDLLDGAALLAAELPPSIEGEVAPGAYTCC